MGFKVLCNYCFYKFGLELSLITMVYVAWLRMDLIGSILICWCLMFSLSRRYVCRLLWPFFLIYLAIELPLQYAMVLGLPTTLCIRKYLLDFKFKLIFFLQNIHGLKCLKIQQKKIICFHFWIWQIIELKKVISMILFWLTFCF